MSSAQRANFKYGVDIKEVTNNDYVLQSTLYNLKIDQNTALTESKASSNVFYSYGMIMD